MSSLLSNPRAEAVLDRLREQDERQSSSMKEHVGSRIRAHRSVDSKYMDVDTEFYRDKLVALDRDKCDFAYLQCRSLQARRVVEVGTSFGVSTIYLGPIRKYPNRVACDCPARGFPLLERFVIGFG